MNRVEAVERMSPDQITGEPEHVVVQIDVDPSAPLMLELTTRRGVLALRQVACPTSARERGMSLGVGDRCGCTRSVPTDERIDHDRPGLGHEALQQSAGVKVGHRRSSLTVWAMVGPVILTMRMRFSGSRVGSVTRPWAASVASRASRLGARFAALMRIRTAI